MKISINILSLCLVLLTWTYTASAQVTVGAGAFVTSFSTLPDYGKGATVTVGWQAKYCSVNVKGCLGDGWLASATDRPEETVEGEVTGQKVRTCIGCAEWLCRMVSNRKHSLNLYLGAGAFGGVNAYEDRKAGCAGVYPALQGEVFIIRRLSFTVDGSYMFEFADPAMKSFPMIGVGLKVLL